mmetsp:Transcript_100852/g.151119  ORF Transcript_100852/g.151119 Transcript_100852/m.151119 type:complete len:230 (+) Transcript_100852:45-734(+)
MVDSRDNTTSKEMSVTFSEPEGSKTSRRGSKALQRKRSSFLQRMGMSFRRSAGERGADVDTLRGTNGADFEGFATISRGEGGGCCSGGDDNSEKLLLIKGPFVFVFKSEEDKAPQYAISLAHMTASSKGGSQGSYVVTLGSNLGDVDYVLNFKDEKIAKFFVDAAKEQAKVGETEEIRKRLGHEQLMTRNKSIKYAETVAMQKVKSQPEKKEKLTAEDMAALNNPVVGL